MDSRLMILNGRESNGPQEPMPRLAYGRQRPTDLHTVKTIALVEISGQTAGVVVDSRAPATDSAATGCGCAGVDVLPSSLAGDLDERNVFHGLQCSGPLPPVG